MQNKKEHGVTELHQKVVRDGVKLEVIATQVGESDWELAVENELGIRSVWYELFETGQLALEAGTQSIELEGTAAFIDTEGFEYLFDDQWPTHGQKKSR